MRFAAGGPVMVRQMIVALLFAITGSIACAQMQTQGPPTSFAGTFVSAAEDSITLRRDDGVQLILPMSQGWFVARARKGDLSDIHAGTFIASRNLPVDADTGTSQEVRFYGDKYRPEYGTHMMSGTETAMTHGTVASVQKTANGTELLVTYPDGKRTLIVPGDISITGYDELGREVLKPGIRVEVVSRKDADGILRAQRVTVE
jgi:hypothetical protein